MSRYCWYPKWYPSFAKTRQEHESHHVTCYLYSLYAIHFRCGPSFGEGQALKTLREAFQKGYPPEDAENDPELKDLRARPAFTNLVKEFGGKK
jgi:hypothetical protein